MRGAIMRFRSAMAVLLLMSVAVAIPTAAHADDSCYRVRASAVTVLDPATGVFSGVASFSLNGVRQRVPASAVVTGPDTTSHTFEFDQGTLVTRDRLVLVPIDADAGLFSLQSQLEVVAGGSGNMQLLPASTVDFATGIASWIGVGRFCFDA